MKTTIVANPRAAAGRAGRSIDTLRQLVEAAFGPTELLTTSTIKGAGQCVTEVMNRGSGRIVVVGGDGTLGQAINGLPLCGADKPTGNLPEIMYIPVGTGCDFARSAGLNNLSVTEIIESAKTRPVDVGVMKWGGNQKKHKTRYFINEASVGASALVVEKVNQSTKRFGGRLSFVLGTFKGLFQWQSRDVRLRIDDSVDKTLPLTALVVANGRYFGGGMKIAPESHLNDGYLEIVVIRDATALTFLRHGAKLFKGNHLDLPFVEAHRGQRIWIEPAGTPSDPIRVESDGESGPILPVEMGLLKNALQLAAPWSRAEAFTQE